MRRREFRVSGMPVPCSAWQLLACCGSCGKSFLLDFRLTSPSFSVSILLSGEATSVFILTPPTPCGLSWCGSLWSVLPTGSPSPLCVLCLLRTGQLQRHLETAAWPQSPLASDLIMKCQIPSFEGFVIWRLFCPLL